uniref:Uncharacterized protein n=1 Tax=Glossina austeni TaxID=7395 RepID=A0A1A9UUS4_GLOAU
MQDGYFQNKILKFSNLSQVLREALRLLQNDYLITANTCQQYGVHMYDNSSNNYLLKGIALIENKIGKNRTNKSDNFFTNYELAVVIALRELWDTLCIYDSCIRILSGVRDVSYTSVSSRVSSIICKEQLIKLNFFVITLKALPGVYWSPKNN